MVTALLTRLWQKTQSVHPADHAHIDAALRELRSLDRTINQDVLRARYQLITSYEPVMRSYRRVEELEATVSRPPRYLDDEARRRLSDAMAGYRASVTAKQGLIETFKYRTAELRDLLGYLPGVGTGLAKAALDAGDERLATDVNEALQAALLYNLTSDEQYAPVIRTRADALAAAGERVRTYVVKRRIGTLVLAMRRLLLVKPDVDRLLRRLFDEPVVEHEERVANIYYGGYAAAEHAASGYRVALYGSCVLLLGLLGIGVGRLQRTAQALAVSNERQQIAGRIQAAILPGEVTVEGLEIAAGMLASDEVGGDYYDIIPVEDGCWIAIGDVAGHGLGAGVIMLMIQSSLQALVALSPAATPTELVCALNRVMHENIRVRMKRDDHVTFCLVRWWSDGRIVFAGAHEDLLIRRADGAVETLPALGTWLGATRDIARATEDTTAELRPGDAMLLYTDGITEARDGSGDLFGDDRLERTFTELCEDSGPARIRDGIFDAAHAWASADIEDDQTVVVVRRTPRAG